MKNKGAVIALTLIITFLCVYYLSFTYVSRGIQEDARVYATDATTGMVDDFKKQNYLDSIWNIPVYNLFGVEYTYKEIKDTELSLGLDLQGGMHVVLEISPVDILRGLSGNNEDPQFSEALKKAQQMQKESQDPYVDLFVDAYKEISGGKDIAPIFATAANRGRISSSDADGDVIKVLKQEVTDAIDRSEIILRTRVDQFGTSQPNIQRLPGTGRIQIEIPGAENPERVRKLLQGVAKLEFWEVVEAQEVTAMAEINRMLARESVSETKNSSELEGEESEDTEVVEEESLQDLLGGSNDTTAVEEDDSAVAAAAAQDSVNQLLDSLRGSQGISPLQALSLSPYYYTYRLNDTSTIGRILRREDVISKLPRNVRIFWDALPKELDNGEQVLNLNFVKAGRGGAPLLEGDVVTDARADVDQYGRPAVSMRMDAVGSRKWATITREAASKTPQGRVAIVLDDYVYSAPTVQGEIPNGNSQITGQFSQDDVKDLANILKAGSLPAPTRIVEEAIVGPTLGKLAQSQGIISILAGLGIVVIFMIAYYSKGGFVANLALVFNIFFIMGILANYNTALTLPGIAGIVLTIGMSIDANVLIFERIREELSRGIKLREAIKEGYSKAFSTIFDSNLTTLIAALVLILFGQGPVKGFAVTLMIGIFSSFFSAVYITRVVVEWMTRKGDESNVRFDSFISQNAFSKLKIDFMGMRKKAYLFSAVIIIVGVSSLLFNGLNMGVDFKGGRSYVVAFGEPVDATTLKVNLNNHFENAGTEVKNFGSNATVKITTAYLVDDESDDADARVVEALTSGLAETTGKTFIQDDNNVDENSFAIASSSKVGATIADDIKMASVESIAYALVLMFIYIAFRFRKWQFGLGAILALFHDTLIVISAYSIASMFGLALEVDQVFIAAILTIIGYSINDTVIVFDRIREYLNLGTSTDKIKIFNSAINNTLNRTVITSATTLFVVLVLLLFGGEVLRGFSFALFIGVLIGTYSSMFIASPTVIDLELSKKKS